ncbi:MAG: hypothetical protein ABI760_05395 [Ferruginibacter sp.]
MKTLHTRVCIYPKDALRIPVRVGAIVESCSKKSNRILIRKSISSLLLTSFQFTQVLK